MGTVFLVLAQLCGLASLVCFILVLVKMFQNKQTVLGIVCIVTFFCCIGGLITFVFGWMNAAAWNIKNLMMAWTAIIVANLLLSALAAATGGLQAYMQMMKMQ